MKLPFLPPKKILSLDIGSYEIKVVEGKCNKKGIIVDKYFTIPTPKGSYNNGKIVDKDLIYYVLNDELKKNKVKTKNVYLTINSPIIITREIIIPKVEYEEIENILSFQIEDYIPMNSEDYIVQFKTIGSIYENNIEKLNILLIAVPKKVIESHCKLLKDLDLNPLVLDYQSNSVAKLIKYNGLINDTYYTENLTFATVDIGYYSTKVSIVKNGIIQVSRIVEIGGKHLDQSILNSVKYNQEEIQEKKEQINDISQVYSEDFHCNHMIKIVKAFFKDLNKKLEIIFEYYLTREIDNKINMILLFGGCTNINGVDNLYSNYFNIPSIKLNFFNNVDFNGELSKYINSIGSIIRITNLYSIEDLNFFEPYIENKEFKINKKIIYYSLVMILIIFLIFYSIFNQISIRRISRDIAKLKFVVEDEKINKKVQYISKKEKEVIKIKASLDKIKLLDRTVGEKSIINDNLLENITSIMPEGIFFTSISMHIDSIQIVGISKDKWAIAELGKGLESIDEFKEIFITNISSGGEHYNFTLNINLKDVDIYGEDSVIEEVQNEERIDKE